ncbi:MAG TPA: 2Fe-2S iron-sulfur cluster-binding protein [Acidisphaera sp.]|nr:2Fe-2S iron-sulfur cluster-binding protein [Acidisphaera sp.]
MRVALTVNGSAVTADVEPRVHLADFLRDHLLLTGTRLGCEHGVCGACTLLLDDEPVRACITLAAECDGRPVRTIEGLDDDPLAESLRAAFTAEHALQCGYCTPGMIVTARDIVRRLPGADEDRIRLELAGNLCRCTGYNGIVRAISRVLRDAPLMDRAAAAPIAACAFGDAAIVTDATVASPPSPLSAPAGNAIDLRIPLALPAATVWQAMQDPTLVAGCVPGASLTSRNGDAIAGTLLAAFGPIKARFAGTGTIAFAPDRQSGRLTGEGRDRITGTRLRAQAAFDVQADGADASVIGISVTYALSGALAQFGRGPLVRAAAAEIAATFGRQLEARLRGAPPAAPQPMRAGALLWHAVLRWLHQLLSRFR